MDCDRYSLIPFHRLVLFFVESKEWTFFAADLWLLAVYWGSLGRTERTFYARSPTRRQFRGEAIESFPLLLFDPKVRFHGFTYGCDASPATSLGASLPSGLLGCGLSLVRKHDSCEYSPPSKFRLPWAKPLADWPCPPFPPASG